jgi:hypothetical protein
MWDYLSLVITSIVILIVFAAFNLDGQHCCFLSSCGSDGHGVLLTPLTPDP